MNKEEFKGFVAGMIEKTGLNAKELYDELLEKVEGCNVDYSTVRRWCTTKGVNNMSIGHFMALKELSNKNR